MADISPEQEQVGGGSESTWIPEVRSKLLHLGSPTYQKGGDKQNS